MMYHFQVEGDIYNRLSLLRFLKPIFYHNPVTLEAIGFREAKLEDISIKQYQKQKGQLLHMKSIVFKKIQI